MSFTYWNTAVVQSKARPPPSTLFPISDQIRIRRLVIREACCLQSSETNKTCHLISKQECSPCLVCGCPWCLEWFSRAVWGLGPLLAHLEFEKGGRRSTSQLPPELWSGLQGALLYYFMSCVQCDSLFLYHVARMWWCGNPSKWKKCKCVQ